MKKNKQDVIDKILDLLAELADESPTEAPLKPEPLEMLTVKECAQEFKGISEHTVRKLVAQRKVRSIRTGEGERRPQRRSGREQPQGAHLVRPHVTERAQVHRGIRDRPLSGGTDNRTGDQAGRDEGTHQGPAPAS